MGANIDLVCDDPTEAANLLSVLDVLKLLGREYVLTFCSTYFQLLKTDQGFLLGKRAQVLAFARYLYCQFFNQVLVSRGGDAGSVAGPPNSDQPEPPVLVVGIDLHLLHRELTSLLTTAGVKLGEGRPASMLPGQPFLLALRARPGMANTRRVRDHLRLELGGSQTSVPIRVLSAGRSPDTMVPSTRAMTVLPRFSKGAFRSGFTFYSLPASTLSAALRAAHQLARSAGHAADTITLTAVATQPHMCRLHIGTSVETAELNTPKNDVLNATVHVLPSVAGILSELGHVPAHDLLVSIKDGEALRLLVLPADVASRDIEVCLAIQISEVGAQT